MKLVIACKSGASLDGPLTVSGVHQARNLAEAIKGKVDGLEVKVFTAWQRPCMETAEILERRLKVRPQGSHILAGHTYIDGAVQISMLRSAAGVCDVLISVSDFDSPMGIVDALAKELFGNPVAHKVVRYRRVEPGTALCLDLESGKLSQLP